MIVAPGVTEIGENEEIAGTKLPIGLVMKESGAKLPTTHLIDPIASLRAMRIADYTLPLLRRKEKKLRKKFGGGKFGKSDFNFQPNSDIQVY